MSSNFDAPLSTQPEWQGQYSFLPPGDNTFSQPYEHVSNTNDNPNNSSAQPRTTATDANTTDINVKCEENSGSPLCHQRSLDPLGLRKQPSPIREHQEPQNEPYPVKSAESIPDESLASTDTATGVSMGSNPLSSVSSAGPSQDGHPPQQVAGEGQEHKEDEEDIVDDEEMGDGDGEMPAQPQTAAERTAQRRKMKRFRLTHQQTRFLMSEFAKQPHPDAAHRERLSREIPGLSPRQVQVWFQNRRAKIKRLTADDRDRMIKMRAVPDDFDNVQALHSPYGAVHGLGTPISSPVDFGTTSYADHMMRPLMVDVRPREGEDHISPTGISPAFGSIGFTPSATMSNPDLLSPLSATSSDRYGYSGHLSTPLSTPRTSNPFATRQGMDMHNRIRPLQPLQLRDTMNRSRSDSLQSPLRTSMSWKGNSIDYSYPGGTGSPQVGGRNGSSGYSSEITNTSTSASGLSYDSGSYSNNAVQSPTGMSNYNMTSTPLQSAPGNRSRLRAASATLPLGLDLRNQYRSTLDPVQQSTATTPRATTAFSTSSTYTSSFPSAPLTAPIDFSMPRTPAIRTTQDYSIPQMSAPIAPPNDFSQAFQSMSGGNSSRTPMRDNFGGGPTSAGPDGRNESDYPSDGLSGGLGLKRKRSFTLPGGVGGHTSTSAPSYGGTTLSG